MKKLFFASLIVLTASCNFLFAQTAVEKKVGTLKTYDGELISMYDYASKDADSWSFHDENGKFKNIKRLSVFHPLADQINNIDLAWCEPWRVHAIHEPGRTAACRILQPHPAFMQAAMKVSSQTCRCAWLPPSLTRSSSTVSNTSAA